MSHRTFLPLRPWPRVLAWAVAWVAVVGVAQFLPSWAAIGLAIALFAAQVLAAPGRACLVAESERPAPGEQPGRRR